MPSIKERLRMLSAYVETMRPEMTTFIVAGGGEQTGTVDDLIAAKGTFVRVLCGNSMEDLDRILRFEIPEYFCVID